jgi:hypothetical protein
MTTLINPASFVAIETDADGDIIGTVEVTLRGKTKRVPARSVPKYGWLFAYGVVGRYHTGTKTWPGSIRQETRDGKLVERVNFGRYDNHPKFRKENCIWFKD